jgi:alkylated DNA repair dioxygenase AlkB
MPAESSNTEHDVFGSSFCTSRLPDDLSESARVRFEKLWALHPEHFSEIAQPFTGKMIPLPRWQQAYGRDYRFTGSVSRALKIPELLEPFLAWARRQLDEKLNGLLLNWYDAEQRHYIGAHRDSTVGLLVGTPIVTISLGATRPFRLRPMKGKGFADFEATHGSVFVLPWESNLNLKHEVPHQRSAKGRRISITLRAFEL